jgi:hemolysin III
MKAFWVKKYVGFSTAVYIFMGWLIVFDLKPILIAMPHTGIVLLVLGGILYTLGAVLFMFDNIPYNHAVWHIFVLAGSTCHFFSMLYLLPR